jgi:hypothetical protein
MSSATGEAEDQEYVRSSRQQLRQIAVDRVVSRRKDVACDLDPDKRRAAAARQRERQATARV